MSATRIPIRPGSGASPRGLAVTITQYSRRGILAIWAAAALPMGLLAWGVAPAVTNRCVDAPLAETLLVCLTAGLVWQFVLVVGLVGYEQRSLRWRPLREALWLQTPRLPPTGRSGARAWLAVLPFVVGFGLRQLIPSIPHPAGRDLGHFLTSHAGKAMLHASWGWFALGVTMLVFNTVLGEELLFRGVLLPRMRGVFGDRDWAANGILFAAYHLHLPWMIPVTLLDTFLIAYPTRRCNSVCVGIAVHSSQTIVFTLLMLTVVF